MPSEEIMICYSDIVIGRTSDKIIFYAVTSKGEAQIKKWLMKTRDLGHGVMGLEVNVHPFGKESIDEIRSDPRVEVHLSTMPPEAILIHIQYYRANELIRLANEAVGEFYQAAFDAAFEAEDKVQLSRLFREVPVSHPVRRDAERRMFKVFPSYGRSKLPLASWLAV